MRLHCHRCRRHRPLVDALESRRLLAAQPLNVNGTPGNDYIEVGQLATAYVVTLNGVSTEHAFADISAINIFCGDGDDIVVFAPNFTLGGYADGGDGLDRMVGGDGPDTFLGAAGKDVLYGGGGNDRLNGAGGHDKVLGENGADRLYGGDGNDYIDGGSSGDRLYPGGGNDIVLGQGGNDVFYAIDHLRDELYGASGNDTAFCDGADLRASLEYVAVA